MAILKAYTPLDMVNFDIWEGDIAVAKPHRLVLAETAGDRVFIFFGDFEYDTDDSVSGLLTGLKHGDSVTLDFEVSNAMADMALVFNPIASGDFTSAMAALFREADTLTGSFGSDALLGADGADLLRGKRAADILHGQVGNDRLYGGFGNDKLYGGRGNDLLVGDQGRDVLKGGVGRDQFVFRESYGHDRIKDFQDDIDTLRLDDNLWGTTLTPVQVIARFAEVRDGDIVFDFGDDELVLKNFTELSALSDDLVII